MLQTWSLLQCNQGYLVGSLLPLGAGGAVLVWAGPGGGVQGGGVLDDRVLPSHGRARSLQLAPHHLHGVATSSLLLERGGRAAVCVVLTVIPLNFSQCLCISSLLHSKMIRSEFVLFPVFVAAFKVPIVSERFCS